MTTNYPPDTILDARNRAWRTLLQSLAVDVLAAVVLAVGPAMASSDFAFTREYWAAIGVLVLKSAVTAVVSYVARRALPPAV